jgi:hypothetical protein
MKQAVRQCVGMGRRGRFLAVAGFLRSGISIDIYYGVCFEYK